MTEEYQPEIVIWEFTPFIPLRHDSPIEAIFMKNWLKRVGKEVQTNDVYFIENERNTFPIIKIFGRWGYPDTRATRVATSLINWLGSPIGTGFVEQAQSMFELLNKHRPHEKQNAYIIEWGIKNSPDGLGKPLRQHIMGDEQLTLADVKNMEKILHWLGGEDGQNFIQTCLQERDVYFRQQRQVRLHHAAPK